MSASAAAQKRWSIVIPFFNEEAFLGPTLASIATQTVIPDRIILVDNGSTDASRSVAEDFLRAHPALSIVIVSEPQPGKASALKTGLALVDTIFAATCDADTIYPPAYLETADRLFEQGGERMAAVLAIGVTGGRVAQMLARAKGALAALLMPSQAHSGGYGQSFRTSALKDIGGFGPERWKFCLMDHEIIHRLTKNGLVRHHYLHWCRPSQRRGNRARVRWTLSERLLYHMTPRRRRDWFFYEFLPRRFKARGVSELNLREKPWGV